MKSIFLIFILTTSFSPLILTSHTNSGAAAAAVVATKDNEVMFCTICRQPGRVNKANKIICAMCGDDAKFATASMSAARNAANEKRKAEEEAAKRRAEKQRAEEILAEQAAKRAR
jgi:hypothetical protein